jgi:hypothetical protein
MIQGFEEPFVPIFAYRESKKWISWSSLSYVLNRRMALITQFLLSARLKRPLWRIRWSDVSRCGWVMLNHFQHLGNLKKRLSRCRLSDAISCRMALRTHSLPSERIKKTLVISMKRCFGVEMLCEFIFCILGIVRSDLDEGALVMF